MSELGTRPVNLPEWASTGGVTRIVEPSEAKKDEGFIAERPSFKMLNWILNLIYQWISYFDLGRPRTFTALEDALLNLTTGQTGIVNEWSATSPWLAELWGATVATHPATGLCVASDGQFIYVGDDTDHKIRAFKRSDKTYIGQSGDLGSDVTGLHSDGAFLYACTKGGKALKYDLATAAGFGALLFDVSPGSYNFDIFSDGNAVFLCGGSIVGGPGVAYRLSKTNMTTTWTSPALDRKQQKIRSDGQRIYTTGEWTGGGDATTYRLDYDDGTIQDSYEHGAMTYALEIVPDGVIIGGTVVGGVSLRKLDFSLAVVWGTEPGTEGGGTLEIRGCSCDDRFLYVCGVPGAPSTVSLLALNPADGLPIFYPPQLGFSIGDMYGILEDGFGLFVTGAADGGDFHYLYRRKTIQEPRLIHRCAGTERYREKYRGYT